jgi:hypothetical protein
MFYHISIKHPVANKNKWYFAQSSVEYMGHIIFKEGVVMYPSKITSLLQWPSQNMLNK